MQTPFDISRACDLAFHNRGALASAQRAGCYRCGHVIALPADQFTDQPASIEGVILKWADDGQTALCPKCGVDAVLPGIDDPEVLRQCGQHWFSVMP